VKVDNWGYADLEQAVQSIPSWIEAVSWSGPGVAIDRWVVSGHSNGGELMSHCFLVIYNTEDPQAREHGTPSLIDLTRLSQPPLSLVMRPSRVSVETSPT